MPAEPMRRPRLMARATAPNCIGRVRSSPTGGSMKRMTEPRPGQDLLAEETYRALFESAPDAVLVVDSGGSIVALNPQAEHLFGYTFDELRGQPIERLLPARFADSHRA